MVRLDKCYVFMVVSLFIVFPLPQCSSQNSVYRAGVGDVMTIRVIGHQELDSQVTINPDGTITFPFAGTVVVHDLTLEEIREKIVNALSPDYIKFPSVIVRLEEAVSQKFYVYGEVKVPGSYRLDDKTTLLKAIAMAGGFGDYANTRRIKILRPVGDGSSYKEIFINLEEIVNNPREKPDVRIMKEDLIVVMPK